MDYQLIVIREMHHDASENAVKESSLLNIDSFDVSHHVNQTILLLGVLETFDMSSRGCSTIKVENRWSRLIRRDLTLGR